jgi:hypothetical protein
MNFSIVAYCCVMKVMDDHFGRPRDESCTDLSNPPNPRHSLEFSVKSSILSVRKARSLQDPLISLRFPLKN